jgi:hypothetical protein
MSQEPINAETSLEEQLVSYLDGELDGQSCRRIEEMLATDPEVRRKLTWLEQTWEMLDELDTAPVGEDFTRTTMEMVAVAAEKDVRKEIEQTPRRRRRLWLFSVAALFVIGLAGFMAVTLAVPNQNRQLLQALPVLENLDAYRQIKDMQFLRMLREIPRNSALFAGGQENVSVPPVGNRSEESLITHIKSLNPSDQYELQRKYERFLDLPPPEQKRLRQLHEQIQQDPNADELRSVMDHYYQWYKLLPSYSRSDLTSLSTAEERINWIKNRLEADKSTITNRPPPGKDSDKLWAWMEAYANKHEKSFIETLHQWLNNALSKMTLAARHRAVMWMMWQRPPGGPNTTTQLSDADFGDLRSGFTSETQKLLEAKPQSEQFHIIQNWARYLLRQKFGSNMRELVDDKELADFFEKKLDDADRDQLMNLSGDEMQRELLRLYIMQNRLPEMRDHRPGEFPPGPPPPGDGRRPDRP